MASGHEPRAGVELSWSVVTFGFVAGGARLLELEGDVAAMRRRLEY
jgi:hypothetical protein